MQTQTSNEGSTDLCFHIVDNDRIVVSSILQINILINTLDNAVDNYI